MLGAMSVVRSLVVALVALALLAGCGGGETAPSAEPQPTETAVTSETAPTQQGTSETGAREPSFELQDGEFVPMDQVKQAMDEGAALIVVDSRVPEAFAESHIPGALSIPFYEIDERYPELPKDTWIVAYCSCPTAEAEAAVEVLRARGYEKTAVLLEGYPAWVEAGYPTTTGSGA
jgi:rhodanese-related sulfurtransferase